jgi:hypothetical protein
LNTIVLHPDDKKTKCDVKNDLSETQANSTQLENSNSTLLPLSAQLFFMNRYVTSDQIIKLVVETYKKKCGRGISYADLLGKGLSMLRIISQ